jgi:hypothetical protein
VVFIAPSAAGLDISFNVPLESVEAEGEGGKEGEKEGERPMSR